MSTDLLSEMFHEGVRLGAVLHVQGMLVDIESPAEPMRDFLETDAHQGYVVDHFAKVWPEYPEAIKSLLAAYQEERAEDPRHADRVFIEELGDYFVLRCPKPLIVSIDHQIRRYSAANPEGVGLGSFAAGWGYYGTHWMLVDSIEVALTEALEFGRGATAAAWEEAIREGRVQKPKRTAKKKSGVRTDG